MLGWIQRWLDEPAMRFPGLPSLFVGPVPILFDEQLEMSIWLDMLDIGIVTIFVVEHLVGLALAPSRGKYLRHPWRILDAAVILTAVISIVPAVSDALRSSPAPRLIRLGHFVLLAARTGGRLRVPGERAEPALVDSEPRLEVHALYPTNPERFVPEDWSAALTRIGPPDPTGSSYRE